LETQKSGGAPEARRHCTWPHRQ